MTTMITEVYTAFRKAGVPEEEAKAAAEALSEETVATKGDVTKVEKEIIAIKQEIKLLKWMIGLVIVTTSIPLIKEMLAL